MCCANSLCVFVILLSALELIFSQSRELFEGRGLLGNVENRKNPLPPCSSTPSGTPHLLLHSRMRLLLQRGLHRPPFTARRACGIADLSLPPPPPSPLDPSRRPKDWPPPSLRKQIKGRIGGQRGFLTSPFAPRLTPPISSRKKPPPRPPSSVFIHFPGHRMAAESDSVHCFRHSATNGVPHRCSQNHQEPLWVPLRDPQSREISHLLFSQRF